MTITPQQIPFIDVVARAKSAVVVSGDVHMAEIAGARCGSKLLLDVTSSGMTHSWARQSPVFPKYTVAPILTNGMRLAQRLLPFPYLLKDEGSGRSQNYLGLNFGELDFDFANGTLTARIFSEDGLELQHTFFRALGLRIRVPDVALQLGRLLLQACFCRLGP